MTSAFEAGQLIFSYWKYFGFFSYTFTNLNEKLYITPWNFHAVISRIFQSLVTLHTMFRYYKFTQDVRATLSLMEYLSFVIFMELEVACLLIYVVLHKLYNQKKIIMLNTLTSVINRMEGYDMKFGYHRVRKISNILFMFAVIGICYNIAFMVLADSFMNDMGILHELAALYTMLQQHFFAGQYVMMIFIIKQILQNLNGNVSKIQQNQVERIRILSKIMADLTDCVYVLNSTFSLTTLFRFGSIFTLVVLQIFNICAAIPLLDPNNREFRNGIFMLASLMGTTVFCAVEIGAYTFTTEDYIKEVKKYLNKCFLIV